MTLLLVRHAKAGNRRDWAGPDADRPLSAKGRRQADGLVDLLALHPVERVLASPAVRCVESVAPLAAHRGLEIERHDELAEGRGAGPTLALFDELVGVAAVLCSHGDVIPAVLDALVLRDGLTLPVDYPCAKGSAWALEEDGGRIVGARYLPPPS
jgi:8-oxo-dGTP diphosphatase